jgi:formyltetrahydrofolate hydrolase
VDVRNQGVVFGNYSHFASHHSTLDRLIVYMRSVELNCMVSHISSNRYHVDYSGRSSCIPYFHLDHQQSSSSLGQRDKGGVHF